MADISALTSADRVEIFRHLAVDEPSGVNLKVLESIACDNFQEFLSFCDRVFQEKDTVKDVSCTLGDDGKLQFIIERK